MRNSLTASCSRQILRLTAAALLAGTAAACSADANRFADSSAVPLAPMPAPNYTGSVGAAPSGVVQSAPMAPPQGGYAAPAANPYGAAPATYRPPQPNYSAAPAPYGSAPNYAAAPAYGTPPAYAPQPPAGAQPRYSAAAEPHPVAAAPAAVAMSAKPPASGGTHVVASGETLSSLARLYGVPRSTLASANGLASDASLRIGQRMVIPGAASGAAPHVASAAPASPSSPAAKPAAPPPKVAAAPAPAAAAPTGVVSTASAKPAPAAEKPAQTVAAVTPAATSAETQDEAREPGMQFRWPVRGRIISGFGPKPGGQQNEGINLSVPVGTSVRAAEDGVVAYAGSELKGYGNLVLIRHADGWVTAYAHNSELDVKKGDTVKRGQIIAKAGQTGSVTSPQLHFEIRKGSQPVDPAQHLAGL